MKQLYSPYVGIFKSVDKAKNSINQRYRENLSEWVEKVSLGGRIYYEAIVKKERVTLVFKIFNQRADVLLM